MKARQLRTIVVVGGLTAVTLAGCAKALPVSWSGDVVADRQRLMKLHGALWKDIQDKAKAGNIAGIEVSAEALAVSSTRIPAFFPEGSLTDKSKAKPEVWQKWAEFEKAAMALRTEAEKLRDVAAKKDAAATQAVMKDFGRNACGACHQPFRVPPPQQRG